jgi:uncharacterized coiled-coil protein SlyX
MFMKTSIRSLAIITFAFVGIALLPNAQAVNPPPDGGYPGFNTAEGTNALNNLTSGVGNTGAGWFSLFSNTDGAFNTGVGAGTLLFNIGDQASFEGVENTAVGAAALLFNTTGAANTAVGVTALLNNTTGNGNTAVGLSALIFNTTGSSNTALGSGAGQSATTGSNNVYIGAGMLGFPGESNACYIASIFGQTSPSGIPVLIDSSHKLGTTTSSKRFKEEIRSMDEASEALFALKPVSFHYKKEIDPARTSQFGLVAEDVEKVNPDLVVRDKEGKAYSVRYDQVNAMLLNEFLKEHKRLEELNSKLAEQETVIARQRQEFQTTVARQDKEIRALIATVKEQAAQIQRVTAQIELNTSATEVAAAGQ